MEAGKGLGLTFVRIFGADELLYEKDLETKLIATFRLVARGQSWSNPFHSSPTLGGALQTFILDALAAGAYLIARWIS